MKIEWPVGMYVVWYVHGSLIVAMVLLIINGKGVTTKHTIKMFTTTTIVSSHNGIIT